jgi:hypothetical protein
MERSEDQKERVNFWKVRWNENQYDPLMREEEAKKFGETVWQPVIFQSNTPLNLNCQYPSETHL